MRHILSFTMVSIALAFLFVGSGSAYAQKKVHDSQKEKQWRSMETGPWDFEPGWYYYFLHKNYSGAETYWKWSGFKSGYRVRFKEHKSNVKTIMPRRIAQEELQKRKSRKPRQSVSRSRRCTTRKSSVPPTATSTLSTPPSRTTSTVCREPSPRDSLTALPKAKGNCTLRLTSSSVRTT